MATASRPRPTRWRLAPRRFRAAHFVVALVALVVAVSAGCDGGAPAGPPSATSADQPTSVDDVVPDPENSSGTVTVVGAGDIARSPGDGEDTAALIEMIQPDAVLALGDSAYGSGSREEYELNYDPTWGRFRDITRPIPGNHDYRTDGADGYFEYFRGQVNDQPYYAWDAGHWRMYALNCDIDCGRDSAQLRWLEQDRVRYADQPALAYVHEPFFTCSTRHPPLRRLDAIWTLLIETGGQLLLSGHNHAYERFAELDVEGSPTQTGMRQFVVGTGGVTLYPLKSPCADREAGIDDTAGVLRLELGARSYSWEFVGVDGRVRDSGEQALP